MIMAMSAICGTHFGETKLVTSISFNPSFKSVDQLNVDASRYLPLFTLKAFTWTHFHQFRLVRKSAFLAAPEHGKLFFRDVDAYSALCDKNLSQLVHLFTNSTCHHCDIVGMQ